MRYLKGCILLFPVCCLLSLTSGCSKATDDRANVMFVNGCAGTNRIYAWANITKVVGAVNIDYTRCSNYQKMAQGRTTANFYYTANADSLCGGSYLFNTGDHYSLFAGGINTAPTFVVTNDDMTPPAAGNVRIRFINLTSDAAAEDFMVGTQTMATGLANGTCSGFYEVAAGKYQVKGSGSGITVSDSMKLDAGQLYTAMLTGSQAVATGSLALTLSYIANR